MKIGYLGAGAWGFSLACLLASKGYDIVSWSIVPELVKALNEGKEHPTMPGQYPVGKMHFTTSLQETLDHADILIESVTSAGLRSVCEQIKKLGKECPFIITSKGIEQNTGLILPDVVKQVWGEETHSFIGVLSGPSFANEVIKGLPTSVACSAYDREVMMLICEIFTTPNFRIYPNADIQGVCYGGALKNIIAIACGISDGLELGNSSRAALMTRGLHEMRKLAVARGCKPETLYGLSGMGDLCVTCTSTNSRNYRFGNMIAKGMPPQEAQKKIGMVVEGSYTAISALQLSKQNNISMPISEAVYRILFENLSPFDAIHALMTRPIKEEHL